MFKNLIVYSVPAHWDIDADKLTEALAPHAFAPGTSLEETSVGWAPPPVPGKLAELVVPTAYKSPVNG